MFKTALFLSLLLSSAQALNLKEAIQRAQVNNPLIKEQKQNYKAIKASTSSVQSSFLPSLDLAYGYDSYSTPNFVGETASSSASATLSYNLFNGFKDLSLNQSAYAKEKSRYYQKKAALEDLKLRVSLAYIHYLRTLKEIDTAKDALVLLEKQYKDAKNFQEQGIFAKNEALQVHVELLMAQQTLLEAKRNVNIARLSLKRELGGSLEKEELIEELIRHNREVVYEKLEKKMYENRSELKATLAEKRSLEHQHQSLSGEYYPSVDVKLKYQVAGNDVIPNGGVSFLRNDERSFGVSLAWNLYEGGKTKDDRSNVFHQSLAFEEKIKDMKLQLSLQLSQTFQAFKLSESQINVAKMGLEQAKENYRIVNEQFKYNVANTILLLEAQKLLTRAKESFHKAYFLNYDAMAQLERIIEEDIF